MVVPTQLAGFVVPAIVATSAKPGTYSRQTLGVVKQLRQEDAELFSTACKYGWLVDGLAALPASPYLKDYFDANGLPLREFLRLEELGLIRENTLLTPDRSPFNLHNGVTAQYISTYELKFGTGVPHSDLTVSPFRTFTNVGMELYPIAGLDLDRAYERMIIKTWKQWGIQGAKIQK